LIAWNARTLKEDLVSFETQFKHCFFLDQVPEDWKRSKFKELVTSKYGEQREGYNQMKWYKVYNNKTDGGNFPIKYLHFQNDILSHGSRLIIFIVDVNLLLSWGAQVDYGVSQKAKFMYNHKDYNAFTALIGSGLLDCIIFWKWKHNVSSKIVTTRDHNFRRKHMIAHLKARIHGYDLQYLVIVLQLILIIL
jgi:hypothetical protein